MEKGYVKLQNEAPTRVSGIGAADSGSQLPWPCGAALFWGWAGSLGIAGMLSPTGTPHH